MEPPTEDQYMTVEQVATRLQVSRETVIRLLKRKQLRGKKVGHVWRISEKWLQAYMNDEPQEGE